MAKYDWFFKVTGASYTNEDFVLIDEGQEIWRIVMDNPR